MHWRSIIPLIPPLSSRELISERIRREEHTWVHLIDQYTDICILDWAFTHIRGEEIALEPFDFT
jgi:hypothetical protein